MTGKTQRDGRDNRRQRGTSLHARELANSPPRTSQERMYKALALDTRVCQGPNLANSPATPNVAVRAGIWSVCHAFAGWSEAEGYDLPGRESMPPCRHKYALQGGSVGLSRVGFSSS
jgi:hypothetical protein